MFMACNANIKKSGSCRRIILILRKEKILYYGMKKLLSISLLLLGVLLASAQEYAPNLP